MMCLKVMVTSFCVSTHHGIGQCGMLSVGFHLFLQVDYSHVPDEEAKSERG